MLPYEKEMVVVIQLGRESPTMKRLPLPSLERCRYQEPEGAASDLR